MEDVTIRKMLTAALLRRHPRIRKPGSLVRAAVLVPIVGQEEGERILLVRRTDLVEHHKGQISFPGGVYGEEDGDLMRTALRETAEELGLRKEQVEILGRLDDLETVTGFLIAPFVGFIHGPHDYHPSEIEVAEIIEVPLRHLLSPENSGEEKWEYEGKTYVTPYYTFGEHVIWGATGRILKQFIETVIHRQCST